MAISADVMQGKLGDMKLCNVQDKLNDKDGASNKLRASDQLMLQLEEECQELIERRLAIEEDLQRRAQGGAAVSEKMSATLEKSRQQLQQQMAAQQRSRDVCQLLEEEVSRLQSQEMNSAQEVSLLELRAAEQRPRLAQAEHRLSELNRLAKQGFEEEKHAVDKLRQQRGDFDLRIAELHLKEEQWQKLIDFRQQRAEAWEQKSTDWALRGEELLAQAAALREPQQLDEGLEQRLASAVQELRFAEKLRQAAFAAPILASLLTSLWWQVWVL